MLKILVQKWDENKDILEEYLRNNTSLNTCEYLDIVKITFDCIFNHNIDTEEFCKLDVENITVVDNGDYQGTLLFLIPFVTYQPTEYQYLMTYVGYGSCSGCDTLQRIQDYRDNGIKLTDEQVKDFISLCKDIITNTIKPYNYGWRNDEYFTEVETKEA